MATDRINDNANYIEGVQALRGLACLLVLAHHAVYYACQSKGYDFLPYLKVNYGRLGVSIFFVISGYVMGRCLNQGRLFLLHRVMRIYPPYWGAIGISWLLLGLGAADWSAGWPSAFMVKGNEDYRIPFWTLRYEVAFYGIVYLLILLKLSRNAILWFCAAWLAAIIGTDMYAGIGNIDVPEVFVKAAVPKWQILLMPYPILFIAGFAASLSENFGLRQLPPTTSVFGALALWTLGEHFRSMSAAPLFVLDGMAFVLLINACASLKLPKAASRLGDVSYGVYLVHVIIIWKLSTELGAHARDYRLASVVALYFLPALTGGIVYGFMEHKFHVKVIKPVLNAMTRAQRS